MQTEARKTALITGASSGIGRELAGVLAAHGYNLVLVARREDELKRLAQELSARRGITALPWPADLSDPAAPQSLFDAITRAEIEIDVLVNNAGLGSYGFFHQKQLRDELTMLQVNIVSLTVLTRLFLPDMVQRGRGHVLNVASTAAFLPGPLMAVYYASKAFVLSFSEAIANELQGTGVSVTTLCPGPTVTGFQKAAGMLDSKLVKAAMMEARPVAEAAYSGMMQGKTLVIPGLRNVAVTWLTRLLPRAWLTRFVRRIQDSKK